MPFWTPYYIFGTTISLHNSCTTQGCQCVWFTYCILNTSINRCDLHSSRNMWYKVVWTKKSDISYFHWIFNSVALGYHFLRLRKKFEFAVTCRESCSRYITGVPFEQAEESLSFHYCFIMFVDYNVNFLQYTNLKTSKIFFFHSVTSNQLQACAFHFSETSEQNQKQKNVQ